MMYRLLHQQNRLIGEFSSSSQKLLIAVISGRKRTQMEGNRAAAVALCCILILLSGDQVHHMAAMSKFCRCYSQCYPDCRRRLPRFIFVLKCMDDCSPNKKKVAAGDCNKFCLLAICGMALNGQADVASCVDDCTKNPNLHTKFL